MIQRMGSKLLFNCEFAGHFTESDHLLNKTVFASPNAEDMEAVSRSLRALDQIVDVKTLGHSEMADSAALNSIQSLVTGFADVEFRLTALSQERNKLVDFGIATKVLDRCYL